MPPVVVPSGGPPSWRRPVTSPALSTSGWGSLPVRAPVTTVPAGPQGWLRRSPALPQPAEWKRVGPRKSALPAGPVAAAWDRRQAAQETKKRTRAPDDRVLVDEVIVGEGHEAKRRRRAAQREEKFGEMRANRQPGSETVTESNDVSGTTRQRYSALLDPFLNWAAKERMPVKSEEQLDAAGVEWIEELFFRGESLDAGSGLMAALLWRYPWLRRKGGQSLPRVRRGLSGWRKIYPPQTRKPLPRISVALICSALVNAGYRRLAVGVWAAMEFYLRPGEMLSLKVGDFQAPDPTGGLGSRRWTLLLHPLDRGASSKVGAFDSSLSLDLARHSPLASILGDLLRSLGPEEPLVPQTYTEAAKAFSAACTASGTSVHRAVLYSLRHAGPSNDVNDGVRALPGVKARGRWMADASVIRYEKNALVAREIAKLSAATRARAVAAEANIAAVLRGVWQA